MRLNKNYWLAASGTLAVASAIMLFSAHRIEAQFSSPVRVLNTSSAPAINSAIDDPGRIPYQSTLFFNVSGTFNSFTFTFPAVPANHRLVVQRVGGYYLMNTANNLATLSLFAGGNLITTFNAPSNAAFVSVFDTAVVAYIDAGEIPSTTVYATGASAGYTGNQFAYLTGYMLDCSAAPCSPIAH
jgi:hypothetical protein